MLRVTAPQLRTAEHIIRKNEQIIDGLERGVLTPKMAEQMNQCCKMPIELAKLELKHHEIIRRAGRKANVPRSPLLRSNIGLGKELAPTDGGKVRAFLDNGSEDVDAEVDDDE